MNGISLLIGGLGAWALGASLSVLALMAAREAGHRRDAIARWGWRAAGVLAVVVCVIAGIDLFAQWRWQMWVR